MENYLLIISNSQQSILQIGYRTGSLSMLLLLLRVKLCNKQVNKIYAVRNRQNCRKEKTTTAAETRLISVCQSTKLRRTIVVCAVCVYEWQNSISGQRIFPSFHVSRREFFSSSQNQWHILWLINASPAIRYYILQSGATMQSNITHPLNTQCFVLGANCLFE